MYIYKITNNINGNSYVGLKTSTVEDSENYYGSGKLIQDAIKKYGKYNFTKEILERDIANFELLCERERYYIKLYNTKENGYNMTDGGLGMHGYEPTEEHKRNMSKALSGENHPRYGKNGVKMTDETKLKISEKAKLRKGRPVSEETRRKISESLKGRKK